MNDDEISDLDDSIVEDTVHCTLCGMSWVLGGNSEGIICVLPYYQPFGIPNLREGQIKLCFGCAAFVARTYEDELAERDQCKHGVLCGDWCEPCNREYRNARERV